MPELILASSSRYRRELLQRLQLPFRCISPDVDESALAGEPPKQLARRLAEAKAAAISVRYPSAWVIGSDQVAELQGRALGKPGTTERAHQQLRACSGHKVIFHTALSLRHEASGWQRSELSAVEVQFRQLSDQEIGHYLQHEDALDCAGSFRCEALGISLFEAINSQDPTALIGMPLIALCRLLRNAGIDPLTDAARTQNP